MIQLEEELKRTESQTELIHRFLDLTGYGPSDILSVNYETGIFLTRGGGKYRLHSDTVEHISGPSEFAEERL